MNAASRIVGKTRIILGVLVLLAVLVVGLRLMGAISTAASAGTLIGIAVGALVLTDTPRALCMLAFSIAPLGIVQAEIASVTINLPEALLLALCVKEAARAFVRRECPARDLPWFGLALFAAAAAVAVVTGLLRENGARAVLQDARQFTEYLLLYVLVAHQVETFADARRIAAAFVAGAALIGAHGVLQRFTAIGIPGNQVLSDLVYHGAVRSGSFYGATPLGAIMALAIGPALGMMMEAREGRRTKGQEKTGLVRGSPWAGWITTRRGFLLVAVAVLLTAAVFTKTRASWMAIAMLSAIFFVGIRKTRGLVALAVAGVIAFSAVLGPEVADRLGTLSFGKAERSLRMRVQYYTTAAHIAAAAPLLGLGWGCYFYEGDILANERYVERARHERPAGAPDVATVHSAYLQLLVKSGILGLGAFLVLLAGCALSCLRYCSRGCRGAPAYPLFLGVSASLCGYLFHAGLENFFQWPVMAQSFWLLVGLALVLARRLCTAQEPG